MAEKDGGIIGALDCKGGTRQATRHTVTSGISVTNEWRDQGIGSILMTRAITWAKNTGIMSRIELHVFARNEMAIHLYQEFGFATEGKRRSAVYHSGDYLEDLIMALLL